MAYDTLNPRNPRAEELYITRRVIWPAMIIGLCVGLSMIFVDPWGWDQPYIWLPVGLVVNLGIIQLGIAADRWRDRRGT